MVSNLLLDIFDVEWIAVGFAIPNGVLIEKNLEDASGLTGAKRYFG